MFIRFDVIHERDGQTDRQTDTAWQQRPRLCIASRGKKTSWFETSKGAKRLGGEMSRYSETSRWWRTGKVAKRPVTHMPSVYCWRRVLIVLTCGGYILVRSACHDTDESSSTYGARHKVQQQQQRGRSVAGNVEYSREPARRPGPISVLQRSASQSAVRQKQWHELDWLASLHKQVRMWLDHLPRWRCNPQMPRTVCSLVASRKNHRSFVQSLCSSVTSYSLDMWKKQQYSYS